MPKSTKHKKARVADFAKAKLKLGKGKQIANNATNTSITSRSIALPNQSLSEAPKTEPTSRRNLTLPELLVQCRHYSTAVKREALAEIALLLSSHPFLLAQHLLPLVSALSHLITDAAPNLRSAARALLETIFEQLDEDKIATCSKGLVLFTLAALSSLDEGTRIDALKVLDLLMRFVPGEIVRGWDEGNASGKGDLVDRGVGGKVVEALLNVLRVRNVGLAVGQGGFTSAASGDLTPSSRLAILRTLSTFLSLALLSTSSTSNVAWYLAPSFSTPRAYATFLQSFVPSPPVTNPYKLAFPSSTEHFPLASLSLPSSAIPPSNSTTSTTATSRETLLPLLHPTLLAAFLDAAPTAFGPASTSAPSRELETIVAVLNIAKALYWSALGGGKQLESDGREREREERKSLVVLLGHVGMYFPFGADALEATKNAEAEQQFLELNLVFASLVSLLILSSPSTSTSSSSLSSTVPDPIVSIRRPAKLLKKRDKQVAQEGKIATMIETVDEWVRGALKGEHTTPSYPLGVVLSADAFTALEPTLWALLNQPSSSTEETGDVMESVTAYFSGLSAGNEGKKQAFGFIARSLLIGSDPAYVDKYVVGDEEACDPQSAVAKWVVALPKFLWELGFKHPETTETVLLFLHRVASQGPKGIFNTLLPSLLSSLLPFFYLQHPKRGSIPGPFVRLPPSVQLRALDLVYFVGGVGEEPANIKLREAVGVAVQREEVEESVRARWTAVCSLP